LLATASACSGRRGGVVGAVFSPAPNTPPGAGGGAEVSRRRVEGRPRRNLSTGRGVSRFATSALTGYHRAAGFATDGSLGLRSRTTSFWHSDALGGRPPQTGFRCSKRHCAR